MTDFIELTNGVVVRKNSIEAVVDNFDGTLTVSTENNSFTITADFKTLVHELDEEAKIQEEIDKINKQHGKG